MSTAGSDEIKVLDTKCQDLTRRSAEFRTKVVRELMDTEMSKRGLEQDLGQARASLDALRRERDQLEEAVHDARLDVEAFSVMLQKAERSAALLDKGRRSKLGWLVRLLVGKPEAENFLPAPAEVFTYYLRTSPYRIYRSSRFTLRGWLFPAHLKEAVTGVRVRVGDRLTEGHYGLPEPEVAAKYNLQHGNQLPGFVVEFETKAGRHPFSLEACLGARGWFSVLTTPLWCVSAKEEKRD